MAETLSKEVRELRRQLDEVAPGPKRKAERKRILLQIDVKRWKIGLLNPNKYGKKSTGRLDEHDFIRFLKEEAKPA